MRPFLPVLVIVAAGVVLAPGPLCAHEGEAHGLTPEQQKQMTFDRVFTQCLLPDSKGADVKTCMESQGIARKDIPDWIANIPVVPQPPPVNASAAAPPVAAVSAPPKAVTEAPSAAAPAPAQKDQAAKTPKPAEPVRGLYNQDKKAGNGGGAAPIWIPQ